MKLLFVYCFLSFGKSCFSQDSLIAQLKFLINDSENFFSESKGAIERITGKDTVYTSTTSLNGKFNGLLSFRKGKSNWAAFTIYPLESASLKEAKKSAIFWRNIISSIDKTYTEETKDGKEKNIYGNPQYEYLFTKVESNKKSWINVLYAKDKKAYYVYLSLGWQDWL